MSGTGAFRLARAASPTWRQVGLAALALTAFGLLLYGVPAVAQASWAAVVLTVRTLDADDFLVLAAVWLCGLLAHTFVLTAAMPRLTHRRALTLSLTGSAVANLVPFGGAAGIALNRKMTRTWGFGAREFTRYTFLTNTWDILLKLGLPLMALALMVVSGNVTTPLLRTAAWTALIALVISLVALIAVLSSDRVAVVLARVVESVLNAVFRLVRSPRRVHAARAAVLLRRECVDLINARWLRMTLGMIAYCALQLLLLYWSMNLVGAELYLPAIFAGYAVERLLTTLPFTPGGTGLVEVGLGAVLIALGGQSLPVVAGVMIYRAFTFWLEIPVGGAGIGLWLLAQRHRRRCDALRQPRPEDGPLRVAHVTDCYLPALGGIEMHVHDLASHQRAAGLEAQVLTLQRRARHDDPPWVHRMHDLGGAWSTLRLVRGLLLAGRYDVVHAHVSVWSPFSLLVLWTAARARVPTVVTVHSLWFGLGPFPRIAGALMGVRRWPTVWTAVSTAAAENAERTVGLPGVRVLPNATDPERWEPALPRPADDTLTLACVGRLARRKRPMPLVRAIRRLRAETGLDVRLVFVGDGPQRPRLRDYVRRHQLEGAVALTGRLDRAEIKAVLRDVDAYVAPAHLESFGIAALEARCLGLPIVASARGGVRDFVTHGAEGLLVDDDRDLVAALERLARDRDLLERIRWHNTTTPTRHSWAAALERTDDHYRRAAELVAAPAGIPEPARALAPAGVWAG